MGKTLPKIIVDMISVAF